MLEYSRDWGELYPLVVVAHTRGYCVCAETLTKIQYIYGNRS